MRLSITHASYWRAHKSPQWARELAKPGPSVHACINAHAGLSDTAHGLAPYLQSLGPIARVSSLRVLASEPSIGGRYSRSAANARRWLRRIDEAASLAWWRGRAGLTGEALRAYDLSAPPIRQVIGRVIVAGALPDGANLAHVSETIRTMRKGFSDYEISRYEKSENSPRVYTNTLAAHLIQRRNSIRAGRPEIIDIPHRED